MSESTLEDYLNNQHKKLEQLITATTLIQNKDNPAVASELIVAKADVSSIKGMLVSARNDLEILNNQNEFMKNLSNMLDTIKGQIKHMEANLPPKLLHDYAKTQSDDKNHTNKNPKGETPNYRSGGSDLSDDVYQQDKEAMVTNCKKTLFNEPSSCIPRIRMIDNEEFKLIPKYMIGRQSLETVNQFLGTINEILRAKYSLLALGKVGAKKKGEFDLYMSYLKQENSDSKQKGKIYFFTAEDYHRHTKTKLDKTKLNLLTVLRHCKRLREVRAAKAIQYAIILS